MKITIKEIETKAFEMFGPAHYEHFTCWMQAYEALRKEKTSNSEDVK